MTITEHKRLVAANIEDPVVGEWIEVSSDGEQWHRGRFTILTFNATYWIDTPGYDRSSWPYARRPAAAQNIGRKPCSNYDTRYDCCTLMACESCGRQTSEKMSE